MRPSNKRSRSKQNRTRSLGNIVNRVFDSSGPEGKVRGTPQQVIEKYQVLARDAQLSGDRVAAENFLQHSEHYQRMLNEAQAEMAREAEQRREQQQAHQNQQGQNQQGPNRRSEERGGEAQPDRSSDRQQDRQSDRQQDRQPDRQGEGRMDFLGRRNRRNRGDDRNDAVIDDSEPESMLVETPEARASTQSAPERDSSDSAPHAATETATGADRGQTAEVTAAEAPSAEQTPQQPETAAEAEAKPRPARNTRRKAAPAEGGAAAEAGTDKAAKPRRAPRRRKASEDDGATSDGKDTAATEPENTRAAE